MDPEEEEYGTTNPNEEEDATTTVAEDDEEVAENYTQTRSSSEQPVQMQLNSTRTDLSEAGLASAIAR